MKKNRDKATNPTITGWLAKDTHPQIPQVFLALGLILIAIYLFKSHQPYRSARQPVVDSPSYIWISNSSTRDAGLYVANPGQVDNHSPTGGVAAIRYDEAGQAQQIALPPKVANIFFLPIAINEVDIDLLCTLPGVGPVLADRILAKRIEMNGFKNTDDLLQVKGIGPRKLDCIRDHIFIN